MMFRSLVILIILLITANLAKAQFGELFYPLEPDALKAVQDEAPDKEIITIRTSHSGASSAIFDTANFKSDLWSYLMRSKDKPYQYRSYDVYKIGKNFITTGYNTWVNEKFTYLSLKLAEINYAEHNVMDKLRENTVYCSFRSSQTTNDQTNVRLFKTDNKEDIGKSTPDMFINTEIWYFSIHPDLVCLFNAMTGETFCVRTSTGVVDEIPVSAFDIYPNPVKEIMVITLDGITDNSADIRISDIYGKVALCSRSEIRSNTISLPVYQLSPGVYFIRISCGGKDRWSKFIKIE